MGIETAALLIAVGAKAGESYQEYKAANAQEQALELQGKALKLQTEQKTLANYDTMEKVIQAQVAHQTTTGTAFSSPSFNAIQRDTYNTGAKQAKNIELTGDLQLQNIETEKENVKRTLYAQLFGNASSTAMAGASYYNKMPSKETA